MAGQFSYITRSSQGECTLWGPVARLFIKYESLITLLDQCGMISSVVEAPKEQVREERGLLSACFRRQTGDQCRLDLWLLKGSNSSRRLGVKGTPIH